MSIICDYNFNLNLVDIVKTIHQIDTNSSAIKLDIQINFNLFY